MNKNENKISGPELADLFGVSDRYIRQLANDDILKKSGRGQYLLKESIQGYIQFLKDTNSVSADLKDLKLKKETEKLDKDIELKTLKISELKNELHEASIVEKVMSAMLLNLKGKLLSVPNKVAPLIVACDNLGDIQSIVLENIETCLLELSEYSKDLFKNKNIIFDEEEVEDEKTKKGGKSRKGKANKKNS